MNQNGTRLIYDIMRDIINDIGNKNVACIQSSYGVFTCCNGWWLDFSKHHATVYYAETDAPRPVLINDLKSMTMTTIYGTQQYRIDLNHPSSINDFKIFVNRWVKNTSINV